jgi:hypothetical protein
MSVYKRDEILKDLKSHIIEVTFTKVNGEGRVMRCTLDPQYLPPNYNPEHLDEQHQKKENLNNIAAWDVNAGGWRSFRIDSVSYVQIIDTEY